MSTRSNIAVEHCNGSVSNIYCHSSGYPSVVGLLLYVHWSSTRKLRSLMTLGDISTLGYDLDDTIAYHRDRGDDRSPARKERSIAEYQNLAADESYRRAWGYEYMYLYTRKDGWLMKAYDADWSPLHLALIEEKLTA